MIKNKISAFFAAHAMIVLLSAVAVVHLMILFPVLPADIVWGSKPETDSQLIKLEVFALAFNMLLIFFTVYKAGYLKLPVFPRLMRVVFLILFFLFLLNTLGNILSQNSFERYIFTPVTLLLALFSLRLAMDK